MTSFDFDVIGDTLPKPSLAKPPLAKPLANVEKPATPPVPTERVGDGEAQEGDSKAA